MPETKLDRQSVFNTVAKHLLTQMKRSAVSQTCLYRGDNGLKCAVGILIKDEFFHPSFNSFEVSDNRVVEALEKSLGLQDYGLNEADFDFLIGLQNIHDTYEPDFWFNALGVFADTCGLVFNKE